MRSTGRAPPVRWPILLYADLYGMQEKDGERRSLFRYFHGRSSLATWLRAVLAQRYVDHLRAQRRVEPLSDEASATEAPAPDPDRLRYLALVRQALAHAVARLASRDRLRLTCYYVQELTLAETGRILREHEATASRQLARTRRAFAKTSNVELRRESGLTRRPGRAGIRIRLRRRGAARPRADDELDRTQGIDAGSFYIEEAPVTKPEGHRDSAIERMMRVTLEARVASSSRPLPGRRHVGGLDRQCSVAGRAVDRWKPMQRTARDVRRCLPRWHERARRSARHRDPGGSLPPRMADAARRCWCRGSPLDCGAGQARCSSAERAAAVDAPMANAPASSGHDPLRRSPSRSPAAPAEKRRTVVADEGATCLDREG